MPSVKSVTKEIRAEWWQEGEVCVIRRMSYGVKERLNKALVNFGTPESIEVSFSDGALEQHNVSILTAGIVSMTDEEGEPLEVTREVIYEISGLDGEYILEQINELNPTLKGVRNPDGGPFHDAGADGNGSEEGVIATG